MTTTKFHPTLFQTEMIQAILENRKTQTRRIIKDPTLQENPNNVDEEFLVLTVKSKYKVGDVLWVRETFYETTAPELNGAYYYKASIDSGWKLKWKPSIFMPKAACRIFLEITEIRIERLQKISYHDAEQEGVAVMEDGWKNYLKLPKKTLPDYWNNPYTSFQSLWEKINGSKNWDENPFVWVISFKRIDKPENFNINS